MDHSIRSLQRSGDQVAWLRAKIRAGQVSESIKRILCALGYEPMVQALGLPDKISPNQKSFMRPRTFCYYKDGRWLLGMDHGRIAHYICKKYWSCNIAQDLINHEQNMLIDGQTRLQAMNAYPFHDVLTNKLQDIQFRNQLITAILARMT